MKSVIDQESYRSIKPRSPAGAALLSLFPGLGQIYNGQLVKGVTFLLIDLLFPVAFGVSGILHTRGGLISMLVVAVAFIIYRMADGFVVARRLKNYELKPTNNWYIYILFAVLTLVIRTFLDIPTSTGIQTFSVTSPSMAPTFSVGDRVVAQLLKNKWAGIQYGDIIAYNSPYGGVWISRVIALAGDSVEVVEGVVSVNGQRNEVRQNREYVFDGEEAIEFEEELHNKSKISTLRFRRNIYAEGRTMVKKLVPKNEYFLMSDNRDDAIDSRVMGPIKRNDILGKVIYRL